MSGRNQRKADRKRKNIAKAKAYAAQYAEMLTPPTWMYEVRYQLPAGLPLVFPNFALDLIEMGV